MPLLKTLTCELADPDADILQISLGLHHTGASLTCIYLYCKNERKNFVSEMSMASLCDAIRDRASTLEKVVLEGMGFYPGSLVNSIETCRAIRTMREITWVSTGSHWRRNTLSKQSFGEGASHWSQTMPPPPPKKKKKKKKLCLLEAFRRHCWVLINLTHSWYWTTLNYHVLKQRIVAK